MKIVQSSSFVTSLDRTCALKGPPHALIKLEHACASQGSARRHRPLSYGRDMSRREDVEADAADRLLVNMKVPEKELMSDILKRLTGDSALPIYSNVEKFKRGKEGTYSIAEDIKETVKKREMVNAKERLRVGVLSLSLSIFLHHLLFWPTLFLDYWTRAVRFSR